MVEDTPVRLPRPVRALIGVRVINQLGAYVMAFLAVLAGPGLASAALAVFGIAALASRWIGGVLLDRLPPRTLIVLGLTATGITLLVLASAHGPPQILAAVALVGLAFEIYEPATQESLARAVPDGRHCDVYGLLGTSLIAAGAVGGLLAALLLPFGARWLAVADAATCLAAAAIAAALLPREPAAAPAPQGMPGRPTAPRHEQTPARRSARWRPSARLVRLTSAGTAFAIGYLGVLMYMPFVLLERGAPAWLPGLTLTGAAVLAPLTGRLGRRRLDALPHERVLAIGTVFLGVAVLVLAAGRSVPLTVAAYLAWAVADSVLQGRWQALIAEIAPETERPRWFAFFGSSWGVAQPAVPALAVVAGGALPVAGAAFLLVPFVLGRTRRPATTLNGRNTDIEETTAAR